MHCPDCIVEMKKETRKTKIGNRVFYVCPQCGYNEQRSSQVFYEKEELEIRVRMNKRDELEEELNNN